MTWSAPSVTKPPGASLTSEQQQLSPLPLPRNKHKQLVTSGNHGNPLRSGVAKLLSRIIYNPLRQNSGLYRLVHLTVRQAAVSPSRLEAPSSSPPHTGNPARCRLPPALTSSSGREPRSTALRGFAPPHFTSGKGTSARKKWHTDKMTSVIATMKLVPGLTPPGWAIRCQVFWRPLTSTELPLAWNTQHSISGLFRFNSPQFWKTSKKHQRKRCVESRYELMRMVDPGWQK